MSVFIDEDGNAISRSFVWHIASVDAEQVWREAREAHANAWHDEVEADPDPMAAYAQRAQDAAVKAATAVIQAYGDARADAARREALEEAADVIERNGPSDDIGNYDAACHLRALKENPNAG